jgi:hypothetical protein
MPIFQAESRIFFDPFLLFEPGEVFREKHGVLLYFFLHFLFREITSKLGKNGQGLFPSVLPRPAGGELLDFGSGNVSSIVVSGVKFSVSGVFSVPGVFLIMSGNLTLMSGKPLIMSENISIMSGKH